MKVVALIAVLAIAVTANAKQFDGSWFGLECYGCPNSEEGMKAWNEIQDKKELYKKAKGEGDTDYRINITKEKVEDVSNNALSTSVSAWPWINYANYLIFEAKDLEGAKEAVEKVQAILDVPDLDENVEDKAHANWNKKENEQREKIRALLERRIQNLKDLKAWDK